MSDQPMAKQPCEHYWAYHSFAGLSVRLCQLCHEPDWGELRRDHEAIRASERERLGVMGAGERDSMLHDLGMLLEALGLGNFARPESPHGVMMACVAEASRLKGLEAKR